MGGNERKRERATRGEWTRREKRRAAKEVERRKREKEKKRSKERKNEIWHGRATRAETRTGPAHGVRERASGPYNNIAVSLSLLPPPFSFRSFARLSFFLSFFLRKVAIAHRLRPRSHKTLLISTFLPVHIYTRLVRISKNPTALSNWFSARCRVTPRVYAATPSLSFI